MLNAAPLNTAPLNTAGAAAETEPGEGGGDAAPVQRTLKGPAIRLGLGLL